MQQTVQFALVGPGRAGTAIAEALTRAGWKPARVAGRSPHAPSTRRGAERFGAEAVPVGDAGRGVRVVILATPDAAVAATAERVAPSLERHALVVHLAGSLGLEVFDALLTSRPDTRVAAVHPLQTLPGRDDDAHRLAGSWFAVEGDPEAGLLVEAIGGRAFRVADRTLYHAAACVASNHLVALLGQMERLAGAAGVPAEAFGPLIEATLVNVRGAGASGALTGPVARGDAATVARHLDVLAESERPAYRALAREALRLSGRDDPALEDPLTDPVAEGVAP